MGLRGPQPDSPEMRERKGFPGNRGKSKPKQKKSAAALTKLPFAPRQFDKHGRQEWQRVGRVLIDDGKLSVENLKLFESYCHSYSIFKNIQEKLETEDLIVHTGRFQDPKPNPLINLAKDAQNMMLKMLRALQTSTTLSPESKQDPLEQFFKKAEKLKVVKK